jgi:hypothetical protein
MPARTTTHAKKILCLDYFSGGVPTGEAFRGTLEDIKKANSKSRDKQAIDRVSELCFVGALSYFEAFCKDLASSIVSIAPDLIERLRSAGHNTSIDALKAVRLGDQLPAKVGFLILESHDFGGARKINSIYECLLKITPFSKAEASQYEELLRDRNLIVHHGSVFTTRYLEQSKTGQGRSMSDAFMNSLIMDSSRVSEEIEFISAIAKKMMTVSYAGLQSHLAKTSQALDPERKQALEYFRWWGDDDS